jgi:hypothetical protein
MVWKTGFLALAFVLLASAPMASAGEILVELRAEGTHADPHDITVNVGETVTLVYEVSGIADLTGWQDEFYIGGPATPLSVVTGASWWEGVSVNTGLFVSNPDATDPNLLRVLGTNSLITPPYVYTPDPTGSSLVELTFECLGLGDVTVDALLRPQFLVGDPATGQVVGEFPVSQASDARVVIHQLDDGPPRDWSFDYEVNDDLLGQITGTAEGLYPDGTTMAILASPLDPTTVEFLGWELLSDSPGFPGDLGLPDLGGPFPLTSDVSLRAWFGVIPEPTSLALLCGGLALLSRRRRR